MPTPNITLPYLESGQANKEIKHNEALVILDILTQSRVLDKDLTAPPGSPTDGAAYIVAATATGAWVGSEGKIAFWFTEAGAWKFITPKSGWRVFVVDEAIDYEYSGSAWAIYDINTNQIVADAVTFAKMQNIATARILGRSTAGTGDPEELDAASVRTMLSVLVSIDEDNMVSNLDTAVPTQQSVKAYVDSRVAGGVNYRGGYNASTNTPDLDTAPSGIFKGYMYTVTTAGTFFAVAVDAGDVLIAEIDNPTVEADWTIVEKNLVGIGTMAYQDAASYLLLTGGVVTGTLGVGDAGTENSGINIDGTTYNSRLKVNDIGGTEPAQFHIHRHSTTLSAVLIGTRSNSADATHGAVTADMPLFDIYAAGHTGTHYDLFGLFSFRASSEGTISSTSSPGKAVLMLTPDGSNIPAVALTVEQDKRVILENSIMEKSTDGITASATQTQAGSTALSGDWGRITTCTTASDAVGLPKALAGRTYHLKNNGAQVAGVWPKVTGDAIDGGAADAVDANTLAVGAYRVYHCFTAGTWRTMLSV